MLEGHIEQVRNRVSAHSVGRARELNLVLAAVAAGRDMILEGPPGTPKSTLLGVPQPVKGGNRFDGVSWEAGTQGGVFADGARAWLDCSPPAEVPRG
jgi:flavin reductase (DIM6/NTAB) family NADH-FMN oxidoreductase RutF